MKNKLKLKQYNATYEITIELPDTEAISIQPPLTTKFTRVGTERLVVDWTEMNVFTLSQWHRSMLPARNYSLSLHYDSSETDFNTT